ncbi:hypothetical protein PR202_ga21854 [Eleusine coracana subsp. coracana]|uniref:DUF7794 domain-containing protein n=1 Tax=Eleusine coracana subsp. coracana TaxID=191504 RepID=A0AAV5D2J4_ELECO|nr:hypothetical protein PR202_ga21854 [Eleusine coracana subsp. coracana]
MLLQDTSMSLNEVSAAVSVLLGFAPPTSLPVHSSAQLNKVLLPNPFHRPRAVFLLQIDGSHAPVDNFISEASSSFKIRIEDKDELIVIHSDESLDVSISYYLDNDFSNLANWLEGSYQKSSGKLVVPLESGNSLTLLLDKDLEDEYGSTEIVRQGTEVVQRAFTKAFESLQGAYKGKIVGLVISTKQASASLGSIIGAPSSLRISRQLEEASQTNATVCLLMNMPLTRDTLLYSNVKID